MALIRGRTKSSGLCAHWGLGERSGFKNKAMTVGLQMGRERTCVGQSTAVVGLHQMGGVEHTLHMFTCVYDSSSAPILPLGAKRTTSLDFIK